VYGKLLDWQRQYSDNDTSTLLNAFVAGCGSGLANSVISCPSELAKIQLQNQISVKKYKGPWSYFVDIYRHKGISGCYRGMTATVWRETPSYGIYFWCFEAMRPWYDRDQVKLMVAGGLSGVAGWLSTYPFDVAKTRIQAMPLDSVGRASTLGMLMVIWREEGWRGWFRGVNATVLRAFPTNAVIFLTYAWCMDCFAGSAP
jgi:solute carrier family 25 carnitine/acylcarnitine transporter 20/29